MIKYIWQFPQNLLALLIIKITKATHEDVFKDAEIYYAPIKGISLGQYIIVNKNASENTIKHEYGHTRQSKILGPLYLIIVGLPSLTINILSRIKILDNRKYYLRWPESWADKLGEVER
jgi:hypothetical protein